VDETVGESRHRESTTESDDNPDMSKTGLTGGWGINKEQI